MNGMYSLGAVVFIHMHTYIQTHMLKYIHHHKYTCFENWWWNYNKKKVSFSKKLCICLKNKIKITQLEKVRFIEVNELKLTQVESFSFFHFMFVAANASELFVRPI